MNTYQPTRKYFLPLPSEWPMVGALGLFFFLIGIVNIIHKNWYGHYLFMTGAMLLCYTMFGWFSAVIHESREGLHSKKMDRSYRWGMAWFIFSEVAFFGIFFGALFYVRVVILPQLGGDTMTHTILWSQFKSAWPLFHTPNPTLFKGPEAVIAAFGIPALNTFLLLSSALTVTWAHWSLQKNKRFRVNLGLALTILLGLSFLCLQVYEYTEAYTKMGLKLSSGIYGSTFFMLTGFHGAHVTIGLIMLSVILWRCLKGDFEPAHHFGFEAVSWYWHFVDVVWLFLFIFVYWL